MTKNVSSEPLKFTPCDCVFDPVIDIEEVDQFGYLDLRQAFLTGTIDGTLAPESESYSGVDDPDAILPAARDNFERIRQAAAVAAAESAKSAAAAAAAKAEAAAASSAAAE